MHNGIDYEVAKIDGKCQLREGERRLERPILTAPPWLRFAFDSVLGRPRKIGMMIKNGLNHGAGVVERKADAKRQQAREKKYFLGPRARVQLALRADIKRRYRNRRSEEDGNVD